MKHKNTTNKLLNVDSLLDFCDHKIYRNSVDILWSLNRHVIQSLPQGWTPWTPCDAKLFCRRGMGCVQCSILVKWASFHSKLRVETRNSKLRPGTWNPSEQRNWTMWMELVVLVSSDVCELIETDDPMKQRNSPKLRSQVLPTSASRGLPVDLTVFDPVLFIMAAAALKVILLEKWFHNHRGEVFFLFLVNETIMKRRGQRARRTRTQRVQRSRVRAGQGIAGLIVGGIGGGGFYRWLWWFWIRMLSWLWLCSDDFRQVCMIFSSVSLQECLEHRSDRYSSK